MKEWIRYFFMQFVALLLEFLVLTAEQNSIINELEKEELLFQKQD